MKKVLFFVLAAFSLALISCEKRPTTVEVPIQLMYNGAPFAVAGVPVTLASGSASFDALTDDTGLVKFTVSVGTYTATTSYRASESAMLVNYNGSVNIMVPEIATGKEFATMRLELTASKASQLIIKELYFGGCRDNSDTKNFLYDKYAIVYNNSDMEVDASGMCLAMAQISSMSSSNKYTITDGVIEYAAAGWTPASYGIWWFQSGTSVKIAPYSQIVIALYGAIDHTQTYSKSVDLSHADYVTYDPESGFTGTTSGNQYPAPSASIPASHQMKTYVFGQGNVWPMPIKMAAPMLLMPGEDIQAFVKNEANFDNRSSNKSGNYCKIPTSWVLDAIDIWGDADETKNYYRFPSEVNTGKVVFATNAQGYSVYRNVDKAATEAIAENAGKLVYDYAGAVKAEDTDPSGIDAEASIAKGAKIVYMDSNNSDADFHVRKVASIKK